MCLSIAVVTEWEGLAHTVIFKDARLKVNFEGKILLWKKNQAAQFKCKGLGFFFFSKNAFFWKVSVFRTCWREIVLECRVFKSERKENYSGGCVIPALSNLKCCSYVFGGEVAVWFVLLVELLEQPGVECVPGSCMRPFSAPSPAGWLLAPLASVLALWAQPGPCP